VCCSHSPYSAGESAAARKALAALRELEPVVKVDETRAELPE
jgi:hypothetical protein